MIVAYECTFFLPDVHSLKEKRSIVKSGIRNVQHRFNIAISEIDHQSVWQRTTLALVTVSTNTRHAERELERAVARLESMTEWEMTQLDRYYF